ncbi:hypothetical protein DFA_10878 [Cavenderia fasciculata]|uniref:Uncharacterized protein n=1 Tax=Cavenderia fasciculata TaxID=261658 RepID=F4QBN2_CACFS|nr:uncharacterized protein DFA_10878 [Cavenderia fasciculata]EGG14620.1 hypothetical protein DFA_10878 [Cavenderia fasciculata]|eukprot:XP_004351128.1 hypothetical protein DFA_10878 [Cavenderia fasciculata]
MRTESYYVVVNPESKEEWVKEIRDSANNLKRAQIATLLKSHAHKYLKFNF